jgi:hypothetical protein
VSGSERAAILSLPVKAPVLLFAVHERFELLDSVKTVFVIGACTFELAFFLYGRVIAANRWTFTVISAFSIFLNTGTIRLELEIPFPVVFNEDFDVMMKKIPANIIIFLFGCRLVYLEGDMLAAYGAAFLTRGDDTFF